MRKIHICVFSGCASCYPHKKIPFLLDKIDKTRQNAFLPEVGFIMRHLSPNSMHRYIFCSHKAHCTYYKARNVSVFSPCPLIHAQKPVGLDNQ